MASAPPDSRLEALLTHTEWVRSLASELVADPSAADEVIQETWLQVLQRPPRSLTNARGWLASVIRNVARDRARGESARARREQVAARMEAVAASDEAAAHAEQQRALIGHVLALDEVYRSALLLRFYEGMSPREIARMQGVPSATVKTRLARGLDKLRSRLDESFGGDRKTWVGALLPLVDGGAGSALGRAKGASSKIRLGAPTLLIAVLVGGLWVAARWRIGRGEDTASSVTAGQLGHAQARDTSLSTESAASVGVTTLHRESIAPAGAGSYEGEGLAGIQEERLAPVVPIGDGLFDPASDGPRAIAVDSAGFLLAFEYGEHGRCLRFDSSGNQLGEAVKVGYCSDAVRIGDSIFLTKPGVPGELGGRLAKFSTVSLSQTAEVTIEDKGAHWLCNAICVTGDTVLVGAGDDGQVFMFDMSLKPRGKWEAFGALREMDAVENSLYTLTQEDGHYTVRGFSVAGEGLPTAAGEPLVVPGVAADLVALSDHQVLLLREDGELRQYRLGFTEAGSVWDLQGQTDLASEGWRPEANTFARAAYDARAEILYLSFRRPHPRVVAVPYSIKESRRARAHQ